LIDRRLTHTAKPRRNLAIRCRLSPQADDDARASTVHVTCSKMHAWAPASGDRRRCTTYGERARRAPLRHVCIGCSAQRLSGTRLREEKHQLRIPLHYFVFICSPGLPGIKHRIVVPLPLRTRVDADSTWAEPPDLNVAPYRSVSLDATSLTTCPASYPSPGLVVVAHVIPSWGAKVLARQSAEYNV
jgi:hypothetical protein